MVGGHDRVFDVRPKRGFIVDDLHRPPAQDVRWADNNRIADVRGNGRSFLAGACNAVSWLPEAQRGDQFTEPLAIFGPVDRVRTCAQNRNPRPGQWKRQLERRLPTELDNDAHGPFHFYDVQHVFLDKRFKIESIRRVIIRAHRFGVAIHHDGFNAQFP